MITTLAITEFEPQATETIFDVRDIDSYQSGHIKHAINVPLDDIENALKTTQANTIYVLCGGGTKAGKACELMESLDPKRTYVHLIGGTRGAAAAGWQLQASV